MTTDEKQIIRSACMRAVIECGILEDDIVYGPVFEYSNICFVEFGIINREDCHTDIVVVKYNKRQKVIKSLVYYNQLFQKSF